MDQPIAIVAAYVDQTEQRDNFYETFLVEAVWLCLITGLSFMVPAIAWYHRTKEKQIADRRIRYLAHHDALTGLANRTQLDRKIGEFACRPRLAGRLRRPALHRSRPLQGGQ